MVMVMVMVIIMVMVIAASSIARVWGVASTSHGRLAPCACNTTHLTSHLTSHPTHHPPIPPAPGTVAHSRAAVWFVVFIIYVHVATPVCVPSSLRP